MQNKNIDALDKEEYEITLIISHCWSKEIAGIQGCLQCLCIQMPGMLNLEDCQLNSNKLFQDFLSEYKHRTTLWAIWLFVRVSLHIKMRYSNTDPCNHALLVRKSCSMWFRDYHKPGKKLWKPNNVIYLSDNEVWTQGNSKIMILNDFWGNLQ